MAFEFNPYVKRVGYLNMTNGNKVLEMLQQIQNMVLYILNVLDQGTESTEEVSARVMGLSDIIRNLATIIPNAIYDEYKEFFDALDTFCRQCGNPEFLTQQVDNLASSLLLFDECMDNIKKSYKDKLKECTVCGLVDLYMPLSSYYENARHKYGIIYQAKAETLNREEYTCRHCGASDRDRLIISFLKKAMLQEASEHTKLLQIAPARPISMWIKSHCPQIEYDTTDLFMEDVTFRSDIMNMKGVPDESYDVIICSHVLEHVRDDRKALGEMKRILKSDGKIIFLVPVDLNATCIDEEWGLSEEENWRRFGQGDHCRRYDKEGLMERLEEQFCVHALGKDYFGEKVFEQGAFTDTSTLYILTKTKNVSLNLAEEIVVDESLCKEGPLVSVIMSCYNHADYVAEAIESVLGQSYKNIEFLVADDGSSDDSALVMQRYSAYFAKEYYFQDNAGGRHDILKQQAKGKYIALMNSDDVWKKDKLAIQVEYMESHEDCGACLTWCVYTDEQLKEQENTVFIQKNRNSYEWMNYFWKKENVLCNPSSLLRREFSLRNLPYGRAFRQIPDFFNWIDLVQLTSIHIIPHVLIKMRRYQKDGQENASACTKENVIRHLVEEGCGWLGVIRDMDDKFFRQAFCDLMRNPQADTPEEIQCEKYFLMLNHHNCFVQNGALCYFNEIYNATEKCFKEKYHYSRNDFAKDMVHKGIGEKFLNS